MVSYLLLDSAIAEWEAALDKTKQMKITVPIKLYV